MKNAAIAAYGGALFTVIEAAIGIYIGVRQSSHHDNDSCNLSKIEQLNSDCLDDLWHHMREGVPFVFAVSMYVGLLTCYSYSRSNVSYRLLPYTHCLTPTTSHAHLTPPIQPCLTRTHRIGCIAALLSAIAIMAMSRAASIQTAATKYALLAGFIGAAAVTCYELLVTAGESMTAVWVWKQFDLTTSDLQAMTLAWFLDRGQMMWVMSMDELLLAVGLGAAARASLRYGALPKKLGYIAAVGSVLSVAAFILELARFGNWMLFSAIAGIVYAVAGFIILPTFLIGLGRHISAHTADMYGQAFVGLHERDLPVGVEMTE